MSHTNLLFICCLVGAAFAKTEEEIKNMFMEKGMLCINDYSVTEEELVLMNKNTIPDSRNAKCFIQCLFKKVTWMDDEGKFLEEKAVQMAEQELSEEPTKIENAKKLFALCKSVNDETYGADGECERGTSLAKCFLQNAPKMGFKLP